MTEVKRFLQVFTRFSHTVAGILAHSSMQISSRAVMFWGCRWATRTFNSLQRFSMGLRSGDWLGHTRTLKYFLRSPSFVARAVCLGSLSCWKTQPRFIFNALADGRRFSLKISRYMAPFILSFTQISRPGPFAEKQPQSMMFPPLCFTVGMLFFGCNSAFFLLQTRQVEFLSKSSILVSSDHMTFSQSSSGSSKCSLADFRRAWTCTGLSRGTRLALQDLSPWRRSVLLMVAFVTLVPALCRSFTIHYTDTDNEFKQMPLIQVTSGGQRSLLKKKLQVCESQQSCLFVGDQILIFHHNLQINSFKILQCDFLDFFFLFCLS